MVEQSLYTTGKPSIFDANPAGFAHPKCTPWLDEGGRGGFAYQRRLPLEAHPNLRTYERLAARRKLGEELVAAFAAGGFYTVTVEEHEDTDPFEWFYAIRANVARAQGVVDRIFVMPEEDHYALLGTREVAWAAAKELKKRLSAWMWWRQDR